MEKKVAAPALPETVKKTSEYRGNFKRKERRASWSQEKAGCGLILVSLSEKRGPRESEKRRRKNTAINFLLEEGGVVVRLLLAPRLSGESIGKRETLFPQKKEPEEGGALSGPG